MENMRVYLYLGHYIQYNQQKIHYIFYKQNYNFKHFHLSQQRILLQVCMKEFPYLNLYNLCNYLMKLCKYYINFHMQHSYFDYSYKTLLYNCKKEYLCWLLHIRYNCWLNLCIQNIQHHISMLFENFQFKFMKYSISKRLVYIYHQQVLSQ